MKKMLTFAMTTLIALSTIQSKAAIIEDSPLGPDCHKGGDSFQCTLYLMFGLTMSLPTMIVAADGTKTINPELVRAVNDVLNSEEATPEQKEFAMKRLHAITEASEQ